MADGADGMMQGPLWVRRARGKLLRSWTKRYFALSPDGALREYAVDAPALRSKTKRASAEVRPGTSATNTLPLRQELGVRGASIEVLPLSAAGRQHAFQLTAPAGLSLCLSAASQEEMHRWLLALHRSSLSRRGSARDLGMRSAISPESSSPPPPPSPSPPSSLALQLQLPPPPPPLRTLPAVSLASSPSDAGSSSSRHSASSRSPSPRSPPPSPSASEMELAQYEDEFVDVSGVQRSDMAHLSAVYEWINECRVKTTRDVRVGSGDGSRLVPRGSLLVAVNGVSLQTLTPGEIRATLLDGEPVESLRFLRSPVKRGVLKCKASSSSSSSLRGASNPTASSSFTSQLKTMAQLRSSMASRMGSRSGSKDAIAWREHMVEINGDVLTYALVTASKSGRALSYHHALSTTDISSSAGARRRLSTGHLGGNGSAFEGSGGHRRQVKTRARRSIALTGGCAVKIMPERVADGDFCFSVSSASTASSSSSSSRANKPSVVAFQASSEREMRQWINTLRRAIAISEGCVPALDREYIDALEKMSTRDSPPVIRVVRGTAEGGDTGAADLSNDDLLEVIREDVPAMSLSRAKDYESGPPGFDDDDGEDTSGSDADGEPGEVVSPATIEAQVLPEMELSGMLLFLQTQGRFVEALQLVGKNTAMRGVYWREIFQWAGIHATDASARADREDAHATAYYDLLHLPLSEEDEVQVQKDIPRTSKWLSGSLGAPELDADRIQTRLEKLGRVLHAFLSSCAMDEHQRAIVDGTRSIDTDVIPSRSYYMQGMNGIAFILLEVLEDDEVAAFEFLCGLVGRVLPHVFGVYDALDDTPNGASASASGRAGDHFDLFNSLVEVGNVLQDMAQQHVPGFHAALEHAGIPVCLLAYKWFPTLFSDLSLTAYHSQMRFDTMLVIWDACLLLGLEGLFAVSLALFGAAEDAVSALGDDASAEQVSWTVGSVLSRVPPEELITSVCEVLELCAHPVLLKLRNAHRRRLQLGYAKAGNGFSERRAAPSSSAEDVQVAAMTVTDLDSGRQFAISHAGNVTNLGSS